jgi:leucyl aminopeptidase
MEMIVKLAKLEEETVDAAIIGLLEGVEMSPSTAAVDRALSGAIQELVEGGDLSGKSGECAVLYPRGAVAAKRVLVAGLGKPDKLDLDGIRKAAAVGASKARDLGARHIASLVHGGTAPEMDLARRAQAVVEGTMLALYRYPAERQKPPEENKEVESLTLVVQDPESLELALRGARLGEQLGKAVTLVRTLVNHPSNIATPTFLGQTAERIAQEYGLGCRVYDRAWAREQGMGSFLAVTQGAGEPPRFIVLDYDPGIPQAPTVVLVGKAITFDSGGISIKPSENMHLMKGDMAGGAAVLGAMQVMGAVRPPVHVVGLVPATDNIPDAQAFKPGDVVRAMNGKTIEVHSTDAEGRMILADALCYADRYHPAAVIDLATLTGACVVALGANMAAGCFCSEDWLQDKLLQASRGTAERIWPMPLFPEYRETLKSDVADMVHTGGRFGGVGTSAVFLQEFTSYPWAHLDIAGMGFSEQKPANAYTPKGATGYGVRLLVDLVQSW